MYLNLCTRCSIYDKDGFYPVPKDSFDFTDEMSHSEYCNALTSWFKTELSREVIAINISERIKCMIGIEVLKCVDYFHPDFKLLFYNTALIDIIEYKKSYVYVLKYTGQRRSN